MRVLVTGGFGFLGRAVVADLAAAGHEPIILCRRPTGPGMVAADLRDPHAVNMALEGLDIEAVCHLAALTSVRDSFQRPLDYFDTNTSGTVNLLWALADKPVRVVLASTNAVYGPGRTGALAEDLPPNLGNPYAASKAAAEQVVRWHAQSGAVGSAVLRFFNLAGAFDGHGDPDASRIIPAAVRAAAGLIPHVSINGDGSAVRDFVHVRDAAVAVRLAMEAATPGRHEVFNVGTGVGASMAEVIQAVERVSGKLVPVDRRPPAQEAHTLVADNARIRHALGWHPERSSLDQIVGDAWGVLDAGSDPKA